MIDNRLDTQLVKLNTRYQELLLLSRKYEKIERYISYIKHFDIKNIAEALRYRKYAKKNFSTAGNAFFDSPKNIDVCDRRIAVYSCIIGNYDSVIEPIVKEENVDYLMFTDLDLPDNSVWKKIDINSLGHTDFSTLTSAQINRKIKILQTECLQEYDYTIYVDGNIEIVAGVTPIVSAMGECGLAVHYHRSRDCIYDEMVAVRHGRRLCGGDMKKQLELYRKQGFPMHYGLYENSIIVRNNRDEKISKLMESWWKEYLRFPTRDQISFPYVIWKTNFDKSMIYIMGNDIENNPRFNRLSRHSHI